MVSKKGFSLVEVLIAMVVIIIALIPLSNLFRSTQKLAASPKWLSFAYLILSDVQERLLYSNTIYIDEGAGVKVFDFTMPQLDATVFCKKIGVQLPDYNKMYPHPASGYKIFMSSPDRKVIKISVTWKEQGREKCISSVVGKMLSPWLKY